MSKAETLITAHLDTWSSAIKVKSSAGRGSGKKQEFYGIKKMRELILELAVRGLLVPQDPKDEPVSELLKRIAKEQNRLIREGVVTKQKSPNLVSEKETPFNLPKGWHWIRLSEVAYPQAGFAFKSKDFNESLQGLPLVRIRDVGQPFTGTYYDGEFREEFIINNGDYLISMDGNFRVAPWNLGEALLNQRVTRLIFYGDELPQKFCAISLQLRLSELQGVKAYTTVDHLSGGQIANSVVALPPLAEQHRIVAKVDELMALCDQLEQQQEDSVRTHASLVETLLGSLTAASERGAFAEAWQRITTHFDTLFTTESSIDQLKQTIIQLAVMGKLVEQDPEDEPVSKLLKKVADQKEWLIKNKKIKRQTKFPNLNRDQTSSEIPKGWAITQVGNLGNPTESSIVDGPFGSSINTQRDYVRSGIPVTRMSNISPFAYKRDDLKYINREKFITLRRHNILPGDVLLGKVGSIGNAVIYPDDMPEGLLATTGVARYRVGLIITKEYLCYVLNSMGPHLRSIASQAVQPFLNMKTINSQLVFLPPLAEQHRIVAKVDELMALCDRLKARLQSAQATKVHIADTLVEAAIR